MYKLNVVIEKEDDVFVSHCVELGVTSQGKTVDETLNNLKEACELYIKHAEKEELALIKSKTIEPIITTIQIKWVDLFGKTAYFVWQRTCKNIDK